MEFSQEMLIDLSLNAAGYLIAALLGMTVYSMFRRRSVNTVPVTVEEVSSKPTKQQATNDTEPSEPVKARPAGPTQDSMATDGQFIRFGAAATVSAPTEEKRRDRSEILRIAQQMIKAGANSDKIKQVLPVSDAELSLLELSKHV